MRPIACRFSLLLLTLGLWALADPRPAAADDARPDAGRVLAAYGTLPLSFEANHGQTDSRVTFLSRGQGYTLFLTPAEAVLRLAHANDAPGRVLRMELVGANRGARAVGLDEQAGRTNYFIGNDPARWKTGIPAYSSVRIEKVYRGIDLVYYGNHEQLEYDFVVAPGADPRSIRLGFQGADRIDVDGNGDAVIGVGEDAVRLHKPVAYQEIAGVRHAVEATFVRTPSRQLTFALGDYDHHARLIIDPVLAYSAILGGSHDNVAYAVAVDASGHAYITGGTDSYDFPLTNGIPGATAGYYDVFVTKLSADGRSLIYSTYVGGSSYHDDGFGIAIDAAGSAYVAGTTMSPEFPTTPGAVQPHCHVQVVYCSDGFAFKLDPSGSSLVYSTFIGGSSQDDVHGIAVDSHGSAWVTGETMSSDLPTTTDAFQPRPGRDPMATAFVVKLNPDGSAFEYATYLGGTGLERGTAIAVDTADNVYATGITGSEDFPVTPGPCRKERTIAARNMAKLSPSGSPGQHTFRKFILRRAPRDRG